MSATLFVSRRISLGGRNKVAAIIAVAGVTCAVAVILLTLAVSMGFKNQIKERLHGFNADISVLPAYVYETGSQENYLHADQGLKNLLAKNLPGTSQSLVLRQPGILKTNDDYSAVVFTAFDAKHNFSFEKDNIVNGHWPDFFSDSTYNSIVISNATAQRLNLNVGDKVTACFFIDENIKSRRFTICGLFTSNFGDYDKTVAYCALPALQRICGLDSIGGSAFEINGVDESEISTKAEALQNALIDKARDEDAGEVPVIDNITHTGSMYLNWLDLLDTNVVVIFVIMCCVAAFTLISSLFIIILNSIQSIGILRALGASGKSIRNIFICITLRLVGIGIIAGNVIAIAFMIVQQAYNIVPLDPEMYYLNHMPVEINVPGIIIIDLATFIFAWLVLVLPARMSATISPAKTMRYE